LPIFPNDPYGTPAARPFGFAALLGPAGPAELGSSSLKQAAVLCPAGPALLARANGDF